MHHSHMEENLEHIYHLLLPFAQLIRMDKPVGILNIFFPYFYGFSFTILTAQSVPVSSSAVRWLLFRLVVFTFILRSIGCAWNDIVDVDIDRLVERTKSRPLARGAISLPAAYCFTAGLLVMWSATLVSLMPTTIQPGPYVVPLVILVMIYPYTKRITNYAQIVLGITLGFGVPFGAAFGGIDIVHTLSLAMTSSIKATDFTPLADAFRDERVLGLLILYAIYITWTIIHDTVYAFQDIRDDKIIGVGSMAIRLLRRTKPILSVLCTFQVFLLAGTSVLMHNASHGSQNPQPWMVHITPVWTILRTQWPFIFFAVLGNAVTLFILMIKVDLNNPQNCSWWFKMGSTIIGSSIAMGFASQYIAQLSI